MLTEKEKEKILSDFKKVAITDDYIEKLNKRIREENKEYERIAKAQTLSYDELHRPFDI